MMLPPAPKPNTVTKKWPWWGTSIFYCGVFFFIGLFLQDLETEALFRVTWHWKYLGIAIGVAIFHRAILPLIWLWMGASIEMRVHSYWNYNQVYAKSLLGRYIPGKVAMAATRVALLKGEVSGTTVTVLFLIEQILMIIMMLLVGIIGIFQFGQYLPDSEWIIIASVALFLGLAFLLMPPISNRIFLAVLKLLKIEQQSIIRLPVILRGSLGHFVAQVIMGLYINSAALGIGISVLELDYLFFWGIYCLAGSVSLIAFFAPAGIGIREALLLTLLSIKLPLQTAVLFVTMIRLVDVISDILFFFMANLFLMCKNMKRQKQA